MPLCESVRKVSEVCKRLDCTILSVQRTRHASILVSHVSQRCYSAFNSGRKVVFLNIREAEFAHILDQSQKRNLKPTDGFPTPAVELFDTLDSMPALELRDIVALFLYGQDETLPTFKAAQCKAQETGYAGVELLHKAHGLHLILQSGLDRLRKESPISWRT